MLRSLPQVAAGAFAVLAHAPAQATSLATFVSGTGTDTGACPITAPCKTFQFAHDQTTAGGAIIVLTGGSFGAVNITKSISILAQGTEALITTTLSCDGVQSAICIASGNPVVYLRGLTISLLTGNTAGIWFSAGQALHVQNCVIRRANNGIVFESSTAAKLFVSNSTIADNSQHGLIAQAFGSPYSITLDRTHFDHNVEDGMFFVASNGANKVTLRNSVAAGNGAGVIVQGSGGPSEAVNLMIDRTALVSNSGEGLFITASAAIARIGDSTISGNSTGLLIGGTAQVLSYKTNDLTANGTNGAPTGTLTMK